MSFAYPLGLLGLIGIPVLIIIYIIKNQYTEKTISSTYLWELSERFLKRRLPISKLVGIISLILQILAVLFISLAIAQPVFTLKNAANNYLYVLDGTGSMNFSDGKTTRFERGKAEIRGQIESSTKGSSYTLIVVGDGTDTVFENVTDKERALTLLDDVEGGYREDDLDNAWDEAQKFFDGDNSAKIYLFTDKEYDGMENIEIVNLAAKEDNYGVSNLTVTRRTENLESIVTVSGSVMSYINDKPVTLKLYFDGETEPHAEKEIETVALVKTEFSFEVTDVSDFTSVRVGLDCDDDLSLDNQVVYYNLSHENASRVLIVSETPFFLEAALRAAGTTRITTVSPDDYVASDGYDMYLFERFVPDALPAYGAVWFVNPQKSLEGTNFSNQGTPSEMPRENAVYQRPTSNGVEYLLRDIPLKSPFFLKQYIKCGLQGKFYTLISCEGNPILFAGTTESGNREVVFGFDPKDSAEFILSADFNVLIRNLLTYTFPAALDDTVYYSGDVLTVHVVSGCSSIRIVSPNGEESFPDTNVPDVEYDLNEVGTYTVEMKMSDGSVRSLNVFAALPEAERAPNERTEGRYIEGTKAKSTRDGVYDDLLYLFIILAVVAAADYGVYCYEQYQLR